MAQFSSNNFLLERDETPAWFTSLVSGQWVNIPGSQSFSSGIGGASLGLFNAWSGGVVSQSRKSYLHGLAGGHSSSSRNGIYEFDFNTAVWSTLRADSVDTTNTDGLVPDGSPASNHSYGHLAFADNVGLEYITFLGGTAPDGLKFPRICVFDPVAGTWDTSTFGSASFPNTTAGTTTEVGAAAYDSLTGLVFVAPGYNVDSGLESLMVINPTGLTIQGIAPLSRVFVTGYTLPASTTANNTFPMGECAGNYGVYVNLRSSTASTPVVVWDTSSYATPPATKNPAGMPSISSHAGIAWSPLNDAFLIWPNSGQTVYKVFADDWLNPLTSNWSVTSHTLSGITPDSSYSQGMAGKFRLIEDMGNGEEFLFILPTENSTPAGIRITGAL